MKAICARIVAAFQVPAGPEGDVSKQPSSSQTFLIASLFNSPFYFPRSFFFIARMILLGEYTQFHLIRYLVFRVLFLLMDRSLLKSWSGFWSFQVLTQVTKP